MSRPAIFLDRDGTIIEEREYLSDPAGVVLEKGAAEGLRRLAGLGFALIVVSNQSGIGRGYFGQAELEAVNARIAELLAREGVVIDGWYHCPHAPGQDCDCRKPSPGMVRQAEREHDLDITRSLVIGDKQIDLELGLAVGAQPILVLSGYGREYLAAATRQGIAACESIAAAADVIEADLRRAGAAVRDISATEGFAGGFTVLMAVYARDDAALFRKAVESVRNNTLTPDNFILVVDGPVGPALSEIIATYAAAGVLRPLYLAENKGLPNALNHGLELVTTEWVARADADDFNLPERFQRQADAIRAKPTLGLLGSSILEVDAEGKQVAHRTVPLAHADILRHAARRNPMNHMTVVFRAEPVRAAGGYPDVYGREDYCLWSILLAAGVQSQNLPDTLVHATAGHGMYHRRGGSRHVMAEIALQTILWKRQIKSLPRAVFHGALRIAVALAPSRLRGMLYLRLLRTRPS